MSYLRRGGIVTVVGAVVLIGCATAKEGETTGGLGGAVAGGAAGGAAAGAPAAGVGALVGGALGAAGGAVVGATNEKNNIEKYREEALRASGGATDNPALASAVRPGGTGDLNDDGFVTTDEIIALEKAGLSDDEIIERLRATQQVFGLTADQERKLLDAGVSPRVVQALRGMNANLADPRATP